MARKRVLREGDPRGSPTVLFDRKRRQYYILLADGSTRQYQEVPAGFRLNGRGVLVPAPQEKDPDA